MKSRARLQTPARSHRSRAQNSERGAGRFRLCRRGSRFTLAVSTPGGALCTIRLHILICRQAAMPLFLSLAANRSAGAEPVYRIGVQAQVAQRWRPAAARWDRQRHPARAAGPARGQGVRPAFLPQAAASRKENLRSETRRGERWQAPPWSWRRWVPMGSGRHQPGVLTGGALIKAPARSSGTTARSGRAPTCAATALPTRLRGRPRHGSQASGLSGRSQGRALCPSATPSGPGCQSGGRHRAPTCFLPGRVSDKNPTGAG